MTLFTSQKNNSNFMNRQGCLLLFGLFWIGFSSIFVVIGITQGDTIFTLVGSLFVLIGLAIFFFGLLTLYTRFKVGKPDIQISNTLLRVGESFTVNFYHTFKSSVQVERILVRLVFRETATYQQGTDTRTVTHEEIIDDYEETGSHFQSGATVQEVYNFQIPPSSMHSLEVRRNKLEWFLKIQMQIPKLPDFVEEIKLDVIPEMAGN